MNTETRVIQDATTLAMFFTPRRQFNAEQKYMEDGLKPIEAFCTDIRQNLVVWGVNDNTIFYRTTQFVYAFERVERGNGHLVEMTRIRIGNYDRLDDWANLYSVVDMGREWLNTIQDLRCPVM